MDIDNVLQDPAQLRALTTLTPAEKGEVTLAPTVGVDALQSVVFDLVGSLHRGSSGDFTFAIPPVGGRQATPSVQVFSSGGSKWQRVNNAVVEVQGSAALTTTIVISDLLSDDNARKRIVLTF